MRESVSKPVSAILFLLFSPFIILFGLGLLIYLPVDCLKYFNSPYRKNTNEKYYLFGGLSPYFRLYNIISKNRLPIDFYRDTNVEINSYGYFVYKNTLI